MEKFILIDFSFLFRDELKLQTSEPDETPVKVSGVWIQGFGLLFAIRPVSTQTSHSLIPLSRALPWRMAEMQGNVTLLGNGADRGTLIIHMGVSVVRVPNLF